MVLAVVVVYADVTYFLVNVIIEIPLSDVVIVLIAVVNVGIGVVLEPLGQLHDGFLLLVFVVVVRVNQHVLIVVRNVEVLIDLNVELSWILDLLHLDDELRVEVLQKRTILHYVG